MPRVCYTDIPIYIGDILFALNQSVPHPVSSQHTDTHVATHTLHAHACMQQYMHCMHTDTTRSSTPHMISTGRRRCRPCSGAGGGGHAQLGAVCLLQPVACGAGRVLAGAGGIRRQRLVLQGGLMGGWVGGWVGRWVVCGLTWPVTTLGVCVCDLATPELCIASISRQAPHKTIA
jgi:hypothetical protein